ncbi:MAG: beta-glucanase (GH16 family) [Phycisphaerales bacterium]|jgi:beta-glucanase (GH16 family)
MSKTGTPLCHLALCTLGLLAVPAAAQNYTLVWADEFDGSLISNNWEPMIGDGTLYGLPSGWGNNELQYYTSSVNNVNVSGGALHILVQEEAVGGKSYTSARLRTKGAQDFTYGRFEARIQLPSGTGAWPAFWMLPTDDVYGGWASSGEIDIVESQDRDAPDQIIQALHYGGVWPDNTSAVHYHSEGNGPNKVVFSENYHVYAIEWEPTEIRWYVDGVQTYAFSNWSSAGGAYPAPFDQDFHILLNIAVGGAAPSPGVNTAFPMVMNVDYVRVYQLETTPPQPGTTTHVASINPGTQGGGPNTKGAATVVVQDENGAAVSNATVQVTFTGDYNQTVSGSTDANGSVTLVTSAGSRNPSYTVCVDSVSHASLTYAPGDNLENCDSR